MAAQTEIPDIWVLRFEQDLRNDPLAQNAWKQLKGAGLEEGALFLLWGYAGGADSDIEQMHWRTEDASGKMKAAIRAERIARTASPKRASNPDLFRKRADESRENVLKAEWPVPNDDARTVEDELAIASNVKGREIPLDAARKAMVKAAGERSPVNRFRLLFLLQGYAEKYGVTLGNKRLIALASCADPNRCLDEGTLGRYLRDISESVKEADLRDTLPKLPPPASRKK